MLWSSHARSKAGSKIWLKCTLQTVRHLLNSRFVCLLIVPRPFDKNRLSITLYLQPGGPDMTRLLCRWMDQYNNPLYSCYGVQEICVRRKGSSLQFRRWSTNKSHPTLWMALFFKTWESKYLLNGCKAS